MKRDVMQAAGLESFAELAIIIFFVTFAVIAIKTVLTRKSSFEQVSNLPLDEGKEVSS